MYQQNLIGDVSGAFASLEQFKKIREGTEFAEDIYGNFDKSGLAERISGEKTLSEMPNFVGGGSYSYPVAPTVKGGDQ